MALSRDGRPHLGKVCDVCGGVGFADVMATCSKCQLSCEHIYCMPTTLKEVPREWTCEECQGSNNTVSLESGGTVQQNATNYVGYGKLPDNLGRQGSFKKQKAVDAKVKFLPAEEAILLTSGAKRMNSSLRCSVDSRFDPSGPRDSAKRPPVGSTSPSPELSLMKVKENHSIQTSGHSKPPKHGNMQTSAVLKQKAPQISMELDGKRVFAASAKEYVCREKAIDVCTHSSKVETANRRAEKAKNKASLLSPSIIVSGGEFQSDAEPINSPVMPPKPDCIPSKSAAIDAIWKGSFKIVDSVTSDELYEGFRAHPPCIVHRRAYEFAKQMPPILLFERIPRCSLWEDLFQDDSPDGDDIALYFFPGRIRRSRCDYHHLLDLLEKQDLAMRSCIDGVELLLFTSKQMHMDYQRIGMQYYLWGVFRCVKATETVTKQGENIPLLVSPSEHRDNSEDVDMEIDMIGGKNVGRVDIAVRKVKKEPCNMDVPPGFEKLLKPSKYSLQSILH